MYLEISTDFHLNMRHSEIDAKVDFTRHGSFEDHRRNDWCEFRSSFLVCICSIRIYRHTGRVGRKMERRFRHTTIWRALFLNLTCQNSKARVCVCVSGKSVVWAVRSMVNRSRCTPTVSITAVSSSYCTPTLRMECHLAGMSNAQCTPMPKQRLREKGINAFSSLANLLSPSTSASLRES